MGNRPHWRLPMTKGKGQKAFPGYQSRFGDGHPNRTQCNAVARTTGQRCRKDALQGAFCCQSHGGHRQAYRNAPALPYCGLFVDAEGQKLATVGDIRQGA
jgi:hypothetical protein